MCGPSGSGKTTYAKRFEEHGMIRLSFDVIMWEREITTVPLPQELRDEIEAELRARLLKLVAAGRDGFSTSRSGPARCEPTTATCLHRRASLPRPCTLPPIATPS